MCIFSTPKMPAVTQPSVPQAAKAPDSGAIASEARRRTTSQTRAAASTILTGPSGVLAGSSSEAPTAKKTLLGQ